VLLLLASVFIAFDANSQEPPPLPNGETGIASSYPGDVGLAGDPRVLFADGFEDYTSSNQLVGSGNYNNYYQASNISLDTSVFFDGAKSLKMSMPSTGSEVSNAVVKNISPTRDALYVRVYVRYQQDYSGINSAHNGIRISGNYSGPGRRPDGTDFFLVNIENSRYRSEAEPGFTHAYVYHPEQDDVYGEHWYADGSTSNGAQSFGPFFKPRPNVAPARGEWICFEVLVQLNSPGSRDGRIAVWQDGDLIADWQDVRFRDVESVKIDEIQLENGGQKSTQRNDKWYDNLVVASSYVGPVSESTKAPRPKPPTDVRVLP
jgi:hypothetical protein